MYLTAMEVISMDEKRLLLFLSRELQEGRFLDYKREYAKPASYEGKKEFLKDVTGMANAAGGSLIVGVDERPNAEGFPGTLIGVEDGEGISQLWENITKSCVEPRIPGIVTKGIPLPDGRSAIVVHIPASLRKPHQMVLEKHRGFYIRHGRDTVPMSVDEIRHAVLSVEGAEDRAHAYLLGRELELRETKMYNPCPVLFQAIPLVPLEQEIDTLNDEVSQILYDRDEKLVEGNVRLRSMYLPVPNLWGVEAGSSRDTPDYITEIHRNGCVQGLIFVTQYQPEPSAPGDRWLHALFRDYFKAFLKLCERVTEQQRIAAPYLIRVKWIGARGGYFSLRDRDGFRQVKGPWKMDDLTLPEVVHQPGDSWTLLGDRLFNYLCNAFGIRT